jgi:hypothetical protein
MLLGVFLLSSFTSISASDIEDCYKKAARQKKYRNFAINCLDKFETDTRAVSIKIKDDKIFASKSSLLIVNKNSNTKKLIAGEDTGLTNIKLIAPSTVPDHVIVVNQNNDLSTSVFAINYTRNGNIRPRLIYHSDSPLEDFKDIKIKGTKISFELNGEDYQLEQSSHSKENSKKKSKGNSKNNSKKKTQNISQKNKSNP